MAFAFYISKTATYGICILYIKNCNLWHLHSIYQKLQLMAFAFYISKTATYGICILYIKNCNLWHLHSIYQKFILGKNWYNSKLQITSCSIGYNCLLFGFGFYCLATQSTWSHNLYRRQCFAFIAMGLSSKKKMVLAKWSRY